MGTPLREFEIAKDLTSSDPYLDGILGYTLAMSGNTAKGSRSLRSSLSARHYPSLLPSHRLPFPSP